MSVLLDEETIDLLCTRVLMDEEANCLRKPLAYAVILDEDAIGL